MPEVDLPAVGKVDRRWVWAGAAAAVGIAAVWWARRGDQAEAAAVAEEGDAYDAAVTGSLGGSGYVNPAPGAAGSGSVDSGAHPDTVPEWSNQVTSILADLGYEPAFTAATLGKYLASQPLTAEEASLVRTAWAYAGRPPGGPSTIVLIGSGSTPGTPPPPPPPSAPTPRRTAPSYTTTTVTSPTQTARRV